MDYTPNDVKEDMLKARKKITTLIKDYMEEEGYQLSSASRFTHSLDAFYYQYENTQKSLQLYSNAAPIPFDEFNEELNKKDHEIDTYKMYFYCACGAAAFLFVCLIISIINSNRYKKRLIAKTNRENKVD